MTATLSKAPFGQNVNANRHLLRKKYRPSGYKKIKKKKQLLEQEIQ